ncbi:MAG: hypothetical protein VYD18_03105, partial [Candidatus Latescibacterota bacterium]|nr:hypothetical protein [Candidatus Latescibacterota bacterium]
MNVSGVYHGKPARSLRSGPPSATVAVPRQSQPPGADMIIDVHAHVYARPILPKANGLTFM